MELIVRDCLLQGVDLNILEDDIRFAIRYERLIPSVGNCSVVEVLQI